MRDIRYMWRGNKSVGISNEVALPQIRVLGYRQKATEINLTTGKPNFKTRRRYSPNSNLPGRPRITLSLFLLRIPYLNRVFFLFLFAESRRVFFIR